MHNRSYCASIEAIRFLYHRGVLINGILDAERAGRLCPLLPRQRMAAGGA